MEKVKGFTMIELLIVIAIIGILSVVGLSSFTFSIQKARDSQRKNDLDLIAKAVLAWSNDFGEFPDDDGAGKLEACDYDNSLPFTACSWGLSMSAFTNGGSQLYLSKLPADPSSSYSYYYKKTTDGFALFSVLENINDLHYHADAGSDDGLGTVYCGGQVACNYEVTEGGVK